MGIQTGGGWIVVVGLGAGPAAMAERKRSCNLHQRLPASRTLQDQQRATRPWFGTRGRGPLTDSSCAVVRRKRRGIALLEAMMGTLHYRRWRVGVEQMSALLLAALSSPGGAARLPVPARNARKPTGVAARTRRRSTQRFARAARRRRGGRAAMTRGNCPFVRWAVYSASGVVRARYNYMCVRFGARDAAFFLCDTVDGKRDGMAGRGGRDDVRPSPVHHQLSFKE